jgi:hypothetical protein
VIMEEAGVSAAGVTLPGMRPALKAGLLPVWRDRETVQIGIDPRRAVALTGLARAVGLLGLLDGSRDRDEVITAARAQGISPALTEQVLAVLAAGGALDDAPAPVPERLRAELAAAALARSHSDAGLAALARREAACVQVYGPGRIGAVIADLLAASGVGRVSVCADVGPGGGPPQTMPDLVILLGYHHPEQAARLVRAGVAHLAVLAQEAIGVVGPLVVPGRSACLRCLDLTRSAADPAWPRILAQLTGRSPDPPACGAVLATAVAAQASAPALACIDRVPGRGPAENGTLELVLPAWQWQRRDWPPHPRCGCAAALTVPATARRSRQWGS